jgi:membrane protease YdiL (CAAX protease family)
MFAGGNVSKLVKKYPALSLFFVSSIIGTVFLLLVIQGIVPSFFVFIAASSVSVTGVLLTAITEGKEGVYNLFGQLGKWRVGTQWWIFVVLYLAPANLIGLYLISGNVPDLSNIPFLNVIPLMFVFFVTAGLGEELGWRGYLLPRLQSRYNALYASLITGLLWALWHSVLFLVDFPGFPYFNWTTQHGFITAMFFFIIYLMSWSILYTWVYNNTNGSLLLSCVFHATEVWVNSLMLANGIDDLSMLSYVGILIVMLVTSVTIVIYYGMKNLSRVNERVVLE